MSEERFLQRKEDLKNAVARLQEAFNEDVTDIVIDGALHRFEFTFELAWKTMKDKLEIMGVIEKTGSPREVLKNAFQYKLIEDGEKWIEIMLARNTLSHLYDENESREIYEKVKMDYLNLFLKLIDVI